MASSFLCLAIFLWLPLLHLASANPADWTNHGGDLYNRRYAYGETKISPTTVSNLKLKCEVLKQYALNASNGSVIWQQNIGQLTGLNSTGRILNVNSTVSRSTPTIADDLLIIGIYGPAYVIGIKRRNGELVWSKQLDTHYASLITMSGTYYKSAFYVGTSSSEETVSFEACCTFRGSFFKLNAKNGGILWQTYMLPDNNNSTGEYAGAGIWGSSPSIDIQRNAVYIATGNMYSAPSRIIECQEAQNNQTTPTEEDKCIEPENHSNSVLALDLDSGNIKWYKQLGGYDLWFFACNDLSTSGCPPGPNPDADFAEAPMILTINGRGKKHDIVAVVQKSGIAWALDRDDGSLVWSTEAGPGGAGGGAAWGSATDGKTVYTNIANSKGSNFTLKPSNITTTSGGWVSMNAKNGNVLWSTGNPSNATASGPVSLANGVLFAGSTNGTGPIYAMSAATGQILWSYNTGATVYGGMSISNGCVYVGNGYKVNLGAFDPTYTSGTSLFAFCILP
ncbi:polyvinylalcohol dehydrogenase-like protein [Tanacetum coccineum]|uniref:Polyvinylalcohol dehydrogenase-like protein n=1 Tax=Tanacetum coccineum TaxID=301880 RepID=A0ABQ5HAZ5_9ASTR